MRMDTSRGVTAEQLVNGASEQELAALFHANGETRYSRRIAKMVVEGRPLHTTRELAELVVRAVPAAARRRVTRRGECFRRSAWQSMTELEVLAPALDAAIDLLAPGGHVIVLSYQSVKTRSRRIGLSCGATGGCRCPVDLPCVCGAVPMLRLLNRGARQATSSEKAQNPRAESVRLRIAERLMPSEQVSRS